MKKVDFSFKAMDRRADKSARDDRKTRNATILHKQLGRRICDEKPLLCKASAEIRLGRLSHKRAAAIKGLSRKANAKRSKQ